MRTLIAKSKGRKRQAGISLLEVLIAVALLGVCFSAIFSGLSTALRSLGRIDAHDQAVAFATQKLNELALDAAFAPGQTRSGTGDSGLRWQARAALDEDRPGPAEDRPVQLVRLRVEVSWTTMRGEQSYSLETLKLRIPDAASP